MSWQERVFLLSASLAAATGGLTETGHGVRAAVWWGLCVILALLAAFAGRER